MSDKITASHLERAAYVYVRQSTLSQVRHHKESQRRQYDLVRHARELGFLHIEVVDDDLGVSGSGRRERPGFARLLAAVCAGQVGAVLALEASRLARNNRDWHHLIDLCALTATLVIDYDGVYDPQRLNDRLLLGLKGTMSEFELGLLRQRAQESLRQMIRRGEVLTELPVGYVRTEDNGCEMTPDLQVQSAVRGVFAKFLELGSARQVLLWYRAEDIPLPCTKLGTGGREVLWCRPAYHRILAILSNPTYGGAFVYGRRQAKTKVVDGRARKGGTTMVPTEKWHVLLRDHHTAYISWEQYLRIQDLLQDNSNMRGRTTRGSARIGTALLAGLLRCGRCGRKLLVTYTGRGEGKLVRYVCRSSHVQHADEKCISFAGRKVDEAVATVVLEALQPAGVAAALVACEGFSRQEDEARRQLELAVEKARYLADRARRQYDAVEPENRLVATELEHRWDEALSELQQLQRRLEELGSAPPPLSPEERERLLHLGHDVEALWAHTDAPVTLKKRILRTVLLEIVADVTSDPPAVSLHLHWTGGVHTALQVPKNRPGEHRRRTDHQAVELIRELAPLCDDLQIAYVLNRLGCRTGAGNSWTVSRVESVRRHHEIPVRKVTESRSWLTLEQAAKALQVSRKFLRTLLEEEVLPGRQVVPYAPWVIEASSLELPQVRSAIAARERRRPRHPRAPQELPLFSEA
jgi:DNA invertase Pin-like site-specific DNA recombinase